MDPENYCREQLILYVPFTINESTLKQCFASWEQAHLYYQQTIITNQEKFNHNTNLSWGDMGKAIKDLYIENDDMDVLGIDRSITI